MCGKGGCSVSLDLLLRMCEDCSAKQLASLSDVRKDDGFEDLHPETLNLVNTTDGKHQASGFTLSPLLDKTPLAAAPGQPYKKRPFALRSEIRRVNEELEDLQILDDAQSRSAAPAVGSSRRAVSAPRIRRSESLDAAEASLTSAVAEYVIARKNRLAEEEKVGRHACALREVGDVNDEDDSHTLAHRSSSGSRISADAST